jgi:deoxycytidylate deaminase
VQNRCSDKQREIATILGNEIIVGLTGPFGAGCTTVAEFLDHEPGFKFKRYSFSDIVEASAKLHEGEDKYNKLSRKERRTVLQNEGNRLRQSRPSYIADTLIETIKAKGDEGKDVVVEAFRNPAEVYAFRVAFRNFFLVALDAPSKARFERLHETYGNDLEQFDKDDLRDKGIYEPEHGQRTEECVFLADISINNHKQNVSKKEWNPFFALIGEYVKLLREPGWRPPSYEELYMRQAYALSLKSCCTKRRVGAVIVSESSPDETVKDGKSGKEVVQSCVIAAGFNNVPFGENPCREKGPREDPRFCPKDDAEEKKLRAMNYCPSCGGKLSLPPGKVRNYRCPRCGAALPREVHR